MPTPNPNAITDRRYLERRLEALEAATGQTAPTYGGAAPTPSPLFTTLASGTVGASLATVAHGLSYTPKIYSIVMTSAGIIQSPAANPPDATNVYLQADAASRTANIILGH